MFYFVRSVKGTITVKGRGFYGLQGLLEFGNDWLSRVPY